MRIVIDLQGAQSTGSRNRGIGRYSTSLTEGIIRNRGNHDILVVMNACFPETVSLIREKFSGILPQQNILTFAVSGETRQLSHENDQRREYNEKLREAFIASLCPDVIHVTSLFEGLNDDTLISIGKYDNELPTSTTIYDLIPFINSEIYLENPTVKRWYFDRIDNLRRSDHLLSISESSRREAMEYLGFAGSDVTNVGTAADSQFKPRSLSTNERAKLLRKHGLRSKFLMYTGGIDHRKNIERLIEAYALVPSQDRADCTLAIVCACNESDRKRLSKLAVSHGLTNDDVVMTGFVSEEDLIALYSTCSLFVFPSWHEGFGLPALEAMHCGAPVVGSNCSSLPEVIGWEEAMFDPYSCDEMSEILAQGLVDNGYRQQLRRHGSRQSKKFSWDKSAKVAIAALERLHKSKSVDARPPARVEARKRPRLAYVSPLPPQRSGIASYSSELLPELCRHYEIYCVVPDELAPEAKSSNPLSGDARFISESQFLRDSASYDRVLYHFGNSDYHMHMFSMLDRVPGVIVQHDFFLSGVLSYMENHHKVQNVWSQALYRSHGYNALIERFARDGFMSALWKFPSNRTVFEQALGAIVHSGSTIDLAHKWLPNRLASKLTVVPHMRVMPKKNDRDSARRALNISPEDFVVCSFGIMGETKLSHRLLDAWIASKISTEKCSRLVFVGQADGGDYGRRIADKISNLGYSDRVTITGWADDEQYRLFLQACDIAVQLRTRSRGETSGTILDCMAYGKPTVLNAHGSAAGISPECAMLLPDEFADCELTSALEALHESYAERVAVGVRAAAAIRHEHSPRACADQYAAAIEAFYLDSHSSPQRLASQIHRDGVDIPCAEEMTNLAQAISATMSPFEEKLQYLDISDLASGRHESILSEQLKIRLSDETCRSEPIIWSEADCRYLFARRITLNVLGLPEDILSDEEPVVFARDSSCIILSQSTEVDESIRDRWNVLAANFNISCSFVAMANIASVDAAGDHDELTKLCRHL